jgi:hypothetical protein
MRASLVGVFSYGLLLVLAACESEPAPEPKPQPAPAVPESAAPPVDIEGAAEAARILEQAIAAQGGAERLRAAGQWMARTHGTYLGQEYRAVVSFDGHHERQDIDLADGRELVLVTGEQHCWMRTGPVVVACTDAERARQRQQMTWRRSLNLLELRRPGWSVRGTTTPGADQVHPTLVIGRDDLAGEGKLLFDVDTMFVVRAEWPAHFEGRAGALVQEFDRYREACGIQRPRRITTRFDGRVVMRERFERFFCDPVDAGLFPQPLQVADGTVAVVERPASELACVEHRGQTSSIGRAVGELMGRLSAEQLMPVGPMEMIYTAPPDPEQPQAQRTEVCFPVVAPTTGPEHEHAGPDHGGHEHAEHDAPEHEGAGRPERAGQPEDAEAAGAEQAAADGRFSRRQRPARRALFIYGRGDCAQVARRLAPRLQQVLDARGLAAAGPLRQIAYHDPRKYAADERVSALAVPLAAEPEAEPGSKSNAAPGAEPAEAQSGQPAGP